MDTPNAIIGTLTPEEIAQHLQEEETAPRDLEAWVALLERERVAEIAAYEEGVNNA